MSILFQGRRRWCPAWQVLSLVGLTTLFLLPSIRTGYYAEDLIHSLTPGIVRLHEGTFTKRLVNVLQGNLYQGRFYPLTNVLHTGVHYLIRDVVVYKVLLVAGTVADLVLFYFLVRRLTGSGGFACFAGCVTVGLIQFRVTPDPVLGYYLQVQFVAAGLFVSLVALQLFLQGRGSAWLAASAASYLLIALTYEITYLFFPTHLLLIGRGRTGWKARLATAFPFLGVVGACGLATVLVRRFSLDTTGYVHHATLEPGGYLRAVWHQVSAALPLSYLLADPHGMFSGLHGTSRLCGWLLQPMAVVVALAALAVALTALRRSGVESDRLVDWSPTTAGIGLLLVVLPTLLIASSPFHREQLQLGVGWVPVLIQSHGTGLLLATALWRTIARPSLCGPFARWKCLVAAGLVAVVTGATYRANTEVAIRLNVHDHARRNLESALRAGLLDDVPERSRLLLAHEYPHWHDTMYSPYFYACYASKVLAPVSPSAQARSSPACRQLMQFFAATAVTIREGRPYGLRDVCLGRRSGYVILTQAGPDASEAARRAADGEFRLYVRNPRLFQDGTSPRFRLTGDSPHSARDPEDREYVRLANDLPMIRSGRDWGIFSLRADVGLVDPDSLRLDFGPESSTHGTIYLGNRSRPTIRR